MKANKEKSIDAQAIRLACIEHLDEKSKNDHRKKRYLEYQRKDKEPEDQSTTWTKVPLPIQTSTPPPQQQKLNIDPVASLSKINIPVWLVELLKIPEQMDKVRNFLLHECALEQEQEDLPIFL